MKDLDAPELYINRELSWLAFNTRVLMESVNPETPLLDRLKFLAIYSTNLDEFFMIRVAGLNELRKAGIADSGADKMSPQEQLNKISKYVNDENVVLENSYNEIISKLKEANLYIKDFSELSDDLKKKANRYFTQNIYPIIIPISVDFTHPFPHLNNLSFALIVKLKNITKDSPYEDDIRFGIIRLPRILQRFIKISENTYVTIESVVRENIKSIFPGFHLIASTPFRIIRNADIMIEEEEADDFLELLEQGLRQRQKGSIIKVDINKDTDSDIVDFLKNHIGLDGNYIDKKGIILNLATLWQIVGDKDNSRLLSPKNIPKNIPPIYENSDMFEVLDQEECLLYHPYESFSPITKMIQLAALDKDVLSIRMTLYRVEKNSRIVKALIDAVNSGKQVTVMVELKARFDEENNIIWAKALENAGAHVVYGVSGFKVHSKATQIIKKTKGGKLKFYVHLGTGNYNASTANIYSDISYLTSRTDIAENITKFFHILTGLPKKKELDKLYMSPTQIKPKILSLIAQEAKQKGGGRIIAKVNSLVDTDIIKALYKASMSGTKIDLIVRGICSLRAGLKGYSENIRVISLVGKYLEHARILYFKHSNPKIFISSADWMPRNLVKRFELMVPIYNKNHFEKLYKILTIQLEDNVLSWELQENMSYKKIKKLGKDTINSQSYMEKLTTKLEKGEERISKK